MFKRSPRFGCYVRRRVPQRPPSCPPSLYRESSEAKKYFLGILRFSDLFLTVIYFSPLPDETSPDSILNSVTNRAENTIGLSFKRQMSMKKYVKNCPKISEKFISALVPTNQPSQLVNNPKIKKGKKFSPTPLKKIVLGKNMEVKFV